MRRGRSNRKRCCARVAAAVLCAVAGCAAPSPRPTGTMGSALGGAVMAPAESVERIARLKGERQIGRAHV